MTEYPLLIDGKLVAGDHVLDVVNPATGAVFATCARASEAQLDQAVAAAKRAFPAWAATEIAVRREKLLALADRIDANADELARLLTAEQGKPLAQAGWEIAGSAGFIRYVASLDLSEHLREDSDKRRVTLRRKPLGVVGAIIPWNFPVSILAFKLPFALLAGNCMVVKPAPTTPLAALALGRIMADLFPAGVVNFIADANDLGSQLTGHPDVAKISFTGSTATGRKVMAGAAGTIKRLTLELGGNDAAIVRADAVPADVAPGIFGGAFANSGQVCIAIKRVYVHESLYDEMCDRLAELAEQAVVDDGTAQGTTMGPVQNRTQYDKLVQLLEESGKHGKVIAGGAPIDRAGYFISPTIVRDIEDGAPLVDEEQFGPILPVIRYSDDDDAVRRANNSPYGLGASIWTRDIDAARGLAAKLEAGTVWINKHLDLDPAIPFGGAKQSGLGVEFAQEGLHEFTQLQVVNEGV